MLKKNKHCACNHVKATKEHAKACDFSVQIESSHPEVFAWADREDLRDGAWVRPIKPSAEALAYAVFVPLNGTRCIVQLRPQWGPDILVSGGYESVLTKYLNV